MTNFLLSAEESNITMGKNLLEAVPLGVLSSRVMHMMSSYDVISI
jgi:hypothetical protein